eukprot:95740-Rhodomonas_salina.2
MLTSEQRANQGNCHITPKTTECKAFDCKEECDVDDAGPPPYYGNNGGDACKNGGGDFGNNGGAFGGENGGGASNTSGSR